MVRACAHAQAGLRQQLRGQAVGRSGVMGGGRARLLALLGACKVEDGGALRGNERETLRKFLGSDQAPSWCEEAGDGLVELAISALLLLQAVERD